MSHTNLKTINSVEINNSGPFRVGDQLTSGTTGQVLKSLGESLSPEWSNDTDTTYQGSTTINIDTTTDPDTINVLKVPNALTFTGSSTGTYDGSSALSINLTDSDTTYQGSSTININTSTIPDTINCLKVPGTLTINQNTTLVDTFDGSVNKTINLEGKYIAGDGIDFSGHTIPHIEADTDEVTISHNVGGAEKLQVLKVPNSLTFTGTDTGTYDGSSALSINLTDSDNQLNLTAALPMLINNGGGLNREVELDTSGSTTMEISGGELEVLKVPNVLTFTGTATGTYDGSSALSINLTDTDTTYQGGTNISIDTSTTPDSINLDPSIMNQTLLLFNQTGITTAIIGSAYPNKPTTATYLDLRSATNTIPGGVLATKIQQTYLRRDIGTSYIEYSSNFRTSFVAQSASVMVEFYAVIAAYSSKLFYGALYDYNNSQFFATSQTQHRFKFDNGLDQDPTSCMWYLTGLTAGTTYYISPYFKSSKATSYIYAGNSGTAGSFAPGILRIIDGGNNVGIY